MELSPHPETADDRRRRMRWTPALAALHLVLGLWALWAWIHGPFQGRGIVDGAEVLDLAQHGTVGAFETKSPLYPWILGLALRLTDEVPWTVGLLNLALSCVLLAWIGVVCALLGRSRAAPWAMGLYALSGSTLAFAVQPLPTLMATTLLFGGVWVLARFPRSDGSSALACAVSGGLLAASACTRAPLALAGLLLLVGEALRAPRRALGLAGGAAAVCALAVLAFGARAWPSGGALNLRLGNGGERSGFTDLRPGPAYDRLRWEAAFAPVQLRGEAPEFDAWHRHRLRAELRADPAGAARTLARKAWLFFGPTEIVASADFRHGLRRFPPARALLWSLGLIAPLALASLLRDRRALVWLPIVGVFLANVIYVTSARYRFPALPFLCVAAGVFVAYERRPTARLLAVTLAAALGFLAPARRLITPGDGLVQEGRLLLLQERSSPRTLEVLRAAVRAGQDPRARYELALACETAAAKSGEGRFLDEALNAYKDALRIDPLYAEAGENMVALLARHGRPKEALDAAIELENTSPFAGKAWLNAAELREHLEPGSDMRGHRAQGHLRMALRLLAENAIDQGRLHAEAARALGIEDPRLAPLLDP